MKALAFFLWFAIGTAKATQVPATPMAFDGKQYLTPHQDLPLLLIALERGFPRAVNAGDAGKYVPKEVKSFDEMMTEATRYRAALTEAFQKSMNDQAEKRSARLAAKVMSPPAAPSPTPTPGAVKMPAVPEKVPAFGRESWSAFCACARLSLKALRLRLGAEYQAPDEGAVGAEGILAPNRGDGKLVHAGGMACGRPLGDYGMSARPLGDEIRNIATLVQAGNDDEAQLLWHYFVLYGAVVRQEATKAGGFWDFAWKKVTFQRLVVGQATPVLEALQAAYADYLTSKKVLGTGAIVHDVDRGALQASVREDWNRRYPREGVRTCSALHD